ncbi:DNA polymerase III subunit gamma/tau [Gammaproteobacteria bacterium]|nr:DNA polymerase III subunit gamma/tau [Gammaproteobacteria bacterium]MDB3857076.1 DNA polymerase III subunit gamma/tau [Gammaproteobacteria bacterium]MDB4842377.1 DNA polymerase III subunit gamma/tau [Gammaproteobacteria bacterium]MDB9841354.1 DNA polymerase III subunit gamma/tau [Gammaproteobacteria bacterium]MDC0891767.1 DNA polymerase III subunit gamma/tau [Gammaproteobacteria bacterium]
MSYQVLARKYRPSSFSEVVGQEHVLKALENSISQNKLHQAYIFSGTRGVGKTTIARVFSKCLNCMQADSPQVIPCNKCSACEEIKIGRHMEFLEVDAASRTGVDDMRELLDSVQYKPANARFKIYLIDEVHMLSKSSFNALLKTLEEPPPHVMFLMATTEVEKVPKTVLSRCLQLNLKVIPEAKIQLHLKSLLDLESIEYDEESIALIADSAQGSVRDGLTLLDQAIAHGNGSLNTEDVKALLGTIDQSYIIELVEQVVAGNGDGAYNALHKITELNVEYEQVLKILISVFHKISLHQQLHNNESESIQRLADNLDPQITQLHYEIALNSLGKFHVHPHPKQALELCILRMLAFQPMGEALSPREEKKNLKISSAPKVEIKKVDTEPLVSEIIQNKIVTEPEERMPTETNPSSLDLRSWNSMFDSLELSMFVRQVFSEFEFISFVDKTLVLKKSDDLINPTEGLKTEFIDSIGARLGYKISLAIESGDVIASPAVMQEQEAEEQLNQDKSSLLENPVLKDILDSFDGKIIDESINKVSS